jgi:hypothetical protein
MNATTLTTTPPTEPGLYWVRLANHDHAPVVANVFLNEDTGKLVVAGWRVRPKVTLMSTVADLAAHGARWCGPLEEPK